MCLQPTGTTAHSGAESFRAGSGRLSEAANIEFYTLVQCSLGVGAGLTGR